MRRILLVLQEPGTVRTFGSSRYAWVEILVLSSFQHAIHCRGVRQCVAPLRICGVPSPSIYGYAIYGQDRPPSIYGIPIYGQDRPPAIYGHTIYGSGLRVAIFVCAHKQPTYFVCIWCVVIVCVCVRVMSRKAELIQPMDTLKLAQEVVKLLGECGLGVNSLCLCGKKFTDWKSTMPDYIHRSGPAEQANSYLGQLLGDGSNGMAPQALMELHTIFEGSPNIHLLHNTSIWKKVHPAVVVRGDDGNGTSIIEVPVVRTVPVTTPAPVCDEHAPVAFSLVQKVEELTQKVVELSDQLAAKERRLFESAQGYKRAIGEWNAEVKKRDSEIKSLREERDSLYGKVSAQNVELNARAAEITKLKWKLSDAERKDAVRLVEEKDEEIRKRMELRAEYDAHVSTCTREKSELKDRALSLETSTLHWKRRAEEVRTASDSRIQELQQLVDKAQEELSSMRRAVVQAEHLTGGCLLEEPTHTFTAEEALKLANEMISYYRIRVLFEDITRTDYNQWERNLPLDHRRGAQETMRLFVDYATRCCGLSANAIGTALVADEEAGARICFRLPFFVAKYGVKKPA